DRQADALGTGAGGELGERVRGAGDGLAGLGLGSPQAGLQAGDLPSQVGQPLLERWRVEVLGGRGGFAVEALAAGARGAGVAGGVDASVAEDSGGAGKAIGDGYDAHG